MTATVDATSVDEVIAAAQVAVDTAEQQVESYSPFEEKSRFLLGIIVIVVWTIAVTAIGIWTIAESPDHLCTRPGDAAATGYAGDCVNGWAETRDALQNLLTVAILPVVTLVLGFYFGRQSKSNEPE